MNYWEGYTVALGLTCVALTLIIIRLRRSKERLELQLYCERMRRPRMTAEPIRYDCPPHMHTYDSGDRPFTMHGDVYLMCTVPDCWAMRVERAVEA